MKIKMVAMAFTQNGMFDNGQILSTNPAESFDKKSYPVEFLNHLVDQAGAAERLDYETKIDTGYEPVKKPLSSQSLPPDKALQEKTRGRPPKKQK